MTAVAVASSGTVGASSSTETPTDEIYSAIKITEADFEDGMNTAEIDAANGICLQIVNELHISVFKPNHS